MKETLKKWFTPVCLLIIIFTQLLTYYMKNEINTGFWAVVVALIPAALKGFEVNVSKYLEWLLTIIAVLLIIYTVYITIW